MDITIEIHRKFRLLFLCIDVLREIGIFIGKSLSLVLIDLYPAFSLRLPDPSDPFRGLIKFAA